MPSGLGFFGSDQASVQALLSCRAGLPERERERIGTVAHADSMALTAEKPGERVLESAHFPAEDEPTRLEHAAHGGFDVVAKRGMLAAVVEDGNGLHGRRHAQ